MGEVLGLDYNAVKFVMDLYGVEDHRYVFEQLLYCFELERELTHELPRSVSLGKR